MNIFCQLPLNEYVQCRGKFTILAFALYNRELEFVGAMILRNNIIFKQESYFSKGK